MFLLPVVFLCTRLLDKESFYNMYSKYNSLSDDELCKLINNDDENALNFLLTKYKPLVTIKSHVYFLIGGDSDDIVQEGMIGLFKAIRTYKPSQNNTFKTYAEVCIDNQIKSALRNSNRQKHSSLNQSIPIDSFNETLESRNFGPLDILLYKENYDTILAKIDNELTTLEKKVYNYYIDGKGRKEIAELVNKNEKSISNSLSRIRKKIEILIGEK